MPPTNGDGHTGAHLPEARPAWVATALAWLVVAAIAGRRWWQMGPWPTGLDGGQWLALGRGLSGEGRSSAGAYPPLIPVLAEGLRHLTDPVTALRLLAVGTLLAVLVAIFLVARDGLGPWFGLAALATVGQASALIEPTAFGGYPQQLAFACLLIAAWGAARALANGKAGWYVVAGIALCGAALAHHVYFPLALGTCGLVWLLWLTTGPPRPVAFRRSLWLAIPAAIGLACFAPTAFAFLGGGYAPPLDTSGLGFWAAFAYSTREAVWLWLLVAVAGMISLSLTARAQQHQPAWQVAVALTVGTGSLFVLTGEPRLAPPALTGVVIGLGFGLRALAQPAARRAPITRPAVPSLPRQNGYVAPLTQQPPADAPTGAAWFRGEGRAGQRRRPVLAMVIAFAIPLLLIVPADRAAGGYFTYYRTLDGSLLSAAAAVEEAAPEGTVAVRRDWRNWPIGWWFEGLTTAPIAVGSDPRWLGFPDEVARAALVDRFFTDRLETGQLRDLANETGVELLVLRKWEWIGWQRWLEGADPAVEVLYDDNEFLVLRIRQP